MSDKAEAVKPNIEGLIRSLEDIKQDLPWIERVEITGEAALEDLDANDDLKRETALYGSRGQVARLGAVSLLCLPGLSSSRCARAC